MAFRLHNARIQIIIFQDSVMNAIDRFEAIIAPSSRRLSRRTINFGGDRTYSQQVTSLQSKVF